MDCLTVAEIASFVVKIVGSDEFKRVLVELETMPEDII